jgi:hypothetical protein
MVIIIMPSTNIALRSLSGRITDRMIIFPFLVCSIDAHLRDFVTTEFYLKAVIEL